MVQSYANEWSKVARNRGPGYENSYKVLVDATKDHRAETIDDDTYQARIEARRAYRLRPKGRPDVDGYVQMMCPAAGPSATLTCPLKIAERKSTAGLPNIVNPPEHPDIICTNKTSVTFKPTAGAKYAQKLLYGSQEWHQLYASARNTIEGFNGYVKDSDHGALGDPGRRRAAGFTNQFLFTTLIVAASNIRKIMSFIEAQETKVDPTPRSRKPRRRDRLSDVITIKETPPKT
ncbi:hypothetical protein [Ferrimicrobium sp.]|uniref:hypothetical protein n=1 Tax=Ferrimicrobium sp. TaxID=2926050 RepID=UPI002602CE4F|nr:hypothetical protein [Ferrimicrobium sp.]